MQEPPDKNKSHSSAENALMIERDLALALASATEPEAAIRHGLEAAIRLEDVGCGCALKTNPSAETLELIWHTGEMSEMADQLNGLSLDSPIGEFILKGGPFFGALKDLDFPGFAKAPDFPVRAVGVIPLKDQSEVVGALMVGAKQTDMIPEGSRRILETMASRIEIVLGRLRADRLLRERERQFALLLENAGVPMAIIDSQLRIEYVNKNFTHTFGYRQEHIPTLEDWYHRAYPNEDYRRRIRDEWTRRLRNPQKFRDDVYLKERRVTCRDGSIRYAEIEYSSIGEKNLFVLHDVTERRNAQMDVEGHLRFLKAMMDALPTPVFYKDVKGRYISCNKAFERITGLSADQIRGKKVTDLYDSDLAKIYHEKDMEIIRHPAQQVYESVVRDHSGRPLDVIFSKNAFYRADGSLGGLIGAFVDITDIKKARRETQRLAAAVENAGESIMLTDQDGNIEYVNPAFEQISGYSQGEVMGQNPRFLKTEFHDDRFYERLWKTISAGKVWRGRFCNQAKDGHLFQEEATISPIWGSGGIIVGYVAVKRDVSERELLEQQLRQAQKMEAIGQLASGVAHDFKNALQAIMGHIGIALTEMELDDPLRSDLEQSMRVGKSASRLARQLLMFSREEESSPVAFALDELIRNISSMISRVLGERIQLDVKIEGKLPPIFADPSQIEQALLNLCINARDAMPEGGNLRIEAREVEIDEAYVSSAPWARPGRFCLMTVSDTGSGMGEETRQRVFEPFFTTKSKGEGVGLGLSMVYGIIRNHQGFVNVQSEEGRGSAFLIYLPLADEEQIGDLKKETIEKPPPQGEETILLVEDDEPVRRSTRRALARAGYRVLEAEGPKEAIEIAERYGDTIDLALVDVIMPEGGGQAVFEYIHERLPKVKFIFCSGYSDNFLDKELLAKGSTELLRKPNPPSEILIKIREALDRK